MCSLTLQLHICGLCIPPLSKSGVPENQQWRVSEPVTNLLKFFPAPLGFTLLYYVRVRVQEDFAIVTSRDEMKIKRMSGIIMRRRRYPIHHLVSNLVVETNPRVSHPSPLLSVTPVRASHRKLLFLRIVLYNHPPKKTRYATAAIERTNG